MSPTLASFSDERFNQLNAEWIVVQTATEQRRLAVAEQVASEWDEAFETMSSGYAAVVARGEWQRGPEDLFNVIGIGRNEVRHSAMIAWLLDPLARHGLGPKLLEAIIGKCFPANSFEMTGPIAVETEVARGDTRADIVVWGQRFVLVIEVKIDAGEGDRQCDRLFNQFGDEPGSHFLFLTPSGRTPRTATGEAHDAFQSFSISELRKLLIALKLENGPNDSTTGSTTVINYIRTLEKEFR